MIYFCTVSINSGCLYSFGLAVSLVVYLGLKAADRVGARGAREQDDFFCIWWKNMYVDCAAGFSIIKRTILLYVFTGT